MVHLLKLADEVYGVLVLLLVNVGDVNEDAHAQLVVEFIPLDQDFSLVLGRVKDVWLHLLGRHDLLVEEKRVVLRVEKGLADHKRVGVLRHLLCLLVVHRWTRAVPQLRLVLLTQDCLRLCSR